VSLFTFEDDAPSELDTDDGMDSLISVRGPFPPQGSIAPIASESNRESDTRTSEPSRMMRPIAGSTPVEASRTAPRTLVSTVSTPSAATAPATIPGPEPDVAQVRLAFLATVTRSDDELRLQEAVRALAEPTMDPDAIDL
jgi:hypothetical protein